MVNDRRYKRYFIILENEDRGFEKTNKQVPKGYAKIEVRNGKGLLNVYVQDLKYFKNADYIYRSYLISTKGEKSVYVDTGAFMIDERGKGELKVKFNPDNVEGSEKVIEDFNVVAVIAKPIERSSERTEIYGPLVGYMDKEKVDWKEVLIYEEKGIDDGLDKEYKEKYEEIIDVIEKSSKGLYKEKIEKTEQKKKEVEKEKPKEEDKKDKVEEDKEIKKEYKKYKEYNKDYYEDEEKPDDDCVDSLEKNDNKKVNVEKQEEKEEAKQPEIKQENIKKENIKKEAIKEEAKEEEAKEENIEGEINKEKYTKNNKTRQEDREQMNERYKENYTGEQARVHYKKYHKMVYKYIKDVLKHYQRIEPFEKNIEDYTWWKISYNKQSMYRGFLPFFGYILNIYYFNPYIYYMNNCQSLMSKYGHYMFGISYDKDMEPKYYIYAVPGRYMYKDQPFQGMTGFVYWHSLEDKKPERGDYGYWLLHIDARTGNVAFPMSPTIPPMY